MAKNFRHRTHATQRYAGTTAGFYNDFVHVVGVQNLYPITPTAGFVLVTCIINSAPASGTIVLQVGQDILAEISSSSTATFEHKYNVYLYDQLFVTSPDAATDITFVITRGFGSTSVGADTAD